MFALLGITMSSWLSRIPSIRDALDLSTSTLGVVLLAGAVGGLLTVTVAGPMVTRWGGRLAFLVSAAAFAVGFVLLGVGPATGSVALLATGIFLSGVGAALGNVVLNVESAGVERRLGRTVLPQFHAAFSIGAVIGSLLGAACAWADVPVAVQLVATAVLATAWRLHAVRAIIHDTARGAGAGAGTGTGSRADAGVEPAVHGTLGDAVADVETVHAPRAGRGVRLGAALGAWREPRTLLIGLVVLAAALSEGAANDWLSIAVVDGFDSPEAVGGLVFGTFVAAMTVMRLAGTRLLDRFGRVAVLRASGLTSIVGLLLFGFAPTLGLAGIGVVLWGFGAALAVPVGIAAASDDPRRAAARVSVVSAFASVASLAAPPLLGFAAEHVGARHALVLIVAGMLLSTLVAGAVRRVEAPGYARPAPVPSNPSPEGHAPGVRTPSSDTVHEGASA
ncbi:fucose permease [Sediminihabitans luteus]|uniref:Fucose permease n=1 Tax=Sediminihabitans luteus TaxID=1138585 RepID=A0A2M9CZC4_9CELL|nr:MFS transporter [Sediminihabitans luteus]PJJ77292.1 fucose permease [Sediminihabitans luteus]GII98742.1 MFS transporter [Sediminihabitans luteus]